MLFELRNLFHTWCDHSMLKGTVSRDDLIFVDGQYLYIIFIIYKEIQNGAVANGLLISGEIFAHFLILGSPCTCLIPSFLIFEENLIFFSYQCSNQFINSLITLYNCSAILIRIQNTNKIVLSQKFSEKGCKKNIYSKCYPAGVYSFIE
jgi:hypothetical protein